jgi:uncharacterized protein (DUF1778 family)
MGRKRLSDDERRDKPLRIRLTPEERALVDEAAETREDTSAGWAREVLIREATKVTKKSR